MADQNIVIDIETRTEMAQQRIAAMGQLFKGQTAAMTKSLQGVQEQIQALGKARGFNMPGIRKSSDVMQNQFNPAMQKAKGKINQISGISKTASSRMSQMGSRGKQAGHSMMEAFDGAAMGLMFFGMQVQRIFAGIMRSSISTFQDVHSQLEDSTTATDRLSGAWQYLKFNIGEALQPVMGWLLPIVDTMAKLISENKNLVAGFIITGTVLGTLAMLYGAVKLGMLSLGVMAGRVNDVLKVHMARAYGVAGGLYRLKAQSYKAMAAIGFLTAPVLIAAAAIGALAYEVAKNEKVQDSFADNIGSEVVSSLDNLAGALGISTEHIDSFSHFVSLGIDYLKIAGAVIADVARIASVLFVQAIVSVIEIVKMLGKGIYNLGRVIVELVQGAWQSMLDGFDVMVKKGKAALNIMESIVTVMQNPMKAGEEIDEAASALDTLTEVNMDEFTSNFSGAFDESNYFGGESFMNNVENIASSGQEMIDSFNFQFTSDVIDEVKRQNRLEQANKRAERIRNQTKDTKPSDATEDQSDTKESTLKELLGEQKRSNLLTEQQNQMLQQADVSPKDLFSEKALNYANKTR